MQIRGDFGADEATEDGKREGLERVLLTRMMRMVGERTMGSSESMVSMSRVACKGGGI